MRIDYELGLKRLEHLLTRAGMARSSDDFVAFADLKAGLLASLDEERRLAGLGPAEKTERKRIIRELNRLALQHLGLAFIDLCDVDREPTVPAPPANEMPEDRPEGRRSQMSILPTAYALVVGVGNYYHLRSLSKTTTDARDVHALLARNGYPAANLAILLDGQATKAAISDKLDWLARDAAPEGTVVIFFSGHGARRIGGFEPGEYLCPVEADWYNLRATAISDRELTTALRAIHAYRVIVFIDACHSGGVGKPKDAEVAMKAGLSEAAYERLAAGQGRVVIASCKPDEVSWELSKMRNGLFTHYLLEGLRGAAAGDDGTVRIFNLFDYVSQQVPKHKSQHPLFKGEIDLNFAIALIPQIEAVQQATPTSIPLPIVAVAPSTSLIVNPGFEKGFVGWGEDPVQLQYGSQSVEDTTQAHGGQQSRKLFLRQGGSHIMQNISLPTPLPTSTRITLRVWVKMPYSGSQSNKWLTLELVAISADGRKDSKDINQFDALLDWSQLSVGPLVTGFPVTQLEIHAMTSKGDGSYRGFDQPVWVDDFELDIQ